MRFAADENVNNDLLRGLRCLFPEIDMIRVQDTENYQAGDPVVLAWAAREGRNLITHDVNSMTRYAYERIAAGLDMPGVLVVPGLAPLGKIIEDLALIAGAGEADEWANKVTYLPIS